MIIRSILIGLLVLLPLGSFCPAQQAQVRKVSIKDVNPTSGESMYVAYCAVCHGKDGKGTGPAATAMKTPPTDLTSLAKKKNGKFPFVHVSDEILGDTEMASSHGTKDMPVWGPALLSLTPWSPTAQAQADLRANNIAKYVETLQQK